VCMPTYDERESLPTTLRALRAACPSVDVLVIDDGSPDGTGALADGMAAADPAITVLHRATREGLGAAYLAGFEQALDRRYDVVVEMDADGSHRPQDLPALLAAVDRADVVLGSRYVPGGRLVGWSRSRELLSRVGNAYARRALGLAVRDATGGFRAYRSTVLEKVLTDPVDSQGYCFQIDVLRRAVAAGFTVAEVPITFVERAAGTSKMDRRIVTEALRRTTVWGVQRRRRPT